jgi:hypothetical protein
MKRWEGAVWGAVFLATIGTSLARDGVRIQDPYAGHAERWWRGQVHAHSTTHRYFVHVDSLRDKVERYRDAGYDFVCMTDHNQVTKLKDIPTFPLPTRDPHVPGIHFISGAEIGFVLSSPEGDSDPVRPRKHHFGGVGMDWSVAKGETLFALAETDESTAQAAIDSIATRAYAEGKPALAIVNHPEMEAMVDVRVYPADLRRIRGQAGIEVYNTKWARSKPTSKTWQSHGASHWDYLLEYGAGTRWGFATDDAHEYVFGEDFLGGWIEVAADTLTTEAILDAVRAGSFVACVDSCRGAIRDTLSARFTEIGVRDGTIVAASDRPTEFTWWTDFGHLARTREGALADTFDVEGWERVVRVRIRNDRGAAYSQPFFVDNPDRDAERWKLRREGKTTLLAHFDEGAGAIARDDSGREHHIRILRGAAPPPSEWMTLADTTAWRDSLWGGWMHNGEGTTPDEIDVDRDRSGYALRTHGRDFFGVVDSLALGDRGEGFTIELVGVIRGRTDGRQPILVHESPGEGGASPGSGWRLEVAPAEDPNGDYLFTAITSSGPRTLSFGRGLGEDAQLVAVAVEPGKEGTRVRAFAGGELQSQETWPALGKAPRAPRPLALLHEPLADPGAAPPVYFALRELRITAAARNESAIRQDAERLALTNPKTPTIPATSPR